jgi:integrase
LEKFFDFCQFEGSDIKEKAEIFLKFTKDNGVDKTTDLILNYMLIHINRAAQKIISRSTVRNFYKPIKLFCDMNNIPFNARMITRGIPSGSESSNDRIPTREEILEMLKYPDRRLKPITFTMLSSGIRIGAWDYLKWKNIIPLYNEKKEIIAARIIVYDGEPERYFSFITPEAYYSLKEWMDFRQTQGEKITPESWLMRDLWNTGHIMIRSKESNLKKGTAGIISVSKKASIDSIRMMFNRAWRIQNIRSYTLDMNSKRRHEFKTTHSLRKYFETHALNHMKLLNVKILMGHDTGLEKSYYRPTEKEILDDYLNVVDLLTVTKENKLQKTVDVNLEALNEKVNGLLAEKESFKNDLKEFTQKLRDEIFPVAAVPDFPDEERYKSLLSFWGQDRTPERFLRLLLLLLNKNHPELIKLDKNSYDWIEFQLFEELRSKGS